MIIIYICIALAVGLSSGALFVKKFIQEKRIEEHYLILQTLNEQVQDDALDINEYGLAELQAALTGCEMRHPFQALFEL